MIELLATFSIFFSGISADISVDAVLPPVELPDGTTVCVVDSQNANAQQLIRFNPRGEGGEADDGEPLWTAPLATDGIAVKLGLTPDVDNDLVPDVRVAILGDDPTEPLMTWVRSGRTGDLIFAIKGTVPFDPWMEFDTTADATTQEIIARFTEMTEAVGAGHRIPDFLNEALAPIAHWRAAGDASHTNVFDVGSSGKRSHHRDGTNGNGAPGPGGTPAFVKLKRVEYINTINITRDRAPQAIYPSIWFDSNDDGDADDWDLFTWNAADIRAPICYKAGDPVKVAQARFTVTPPFAIPTNSTTVYGKVFGETIDHFSSTTLSYNAGGTELTATVTGSWPTVAGVIQYIPSYVINWRLHVTTGGGGTTTYQTGQNSNPLYLVLEVPTGNFSLHYTMVHIGCEMADGLTGANHGAIADAIFTEFSDLQVFRATDLLEGHLAGPMTYYGNWGTGNLDAPSLLAAGDGQCGSWNWLFIRSLHTVGIDPHQEWVDLTSYQNPNLWGAAAWFLVDNWAGFSGSGSNPDPAWSAAYPFLNMPNVWPPPGTLFANNAYTWGAPPDITDQAGTQGQGPTPNPKSLFSVHHITKVDGVYYDASYGIRETSIDDYEQKNIAGYGLVFTTGAPKPSVAETDLNADFWDCNGIISPLKRSTGALIMHGNLAGNQLKVQLFDDLR